MSNVTIAERRAIMAASLSQPDFRDLLRSDPRGAVARVTDRAVPDDVEVRVIEEQGSVWEFVVPADMTSAELPEPNDIRDAVENDVYAMLRDEPGVRTRVLGAPKAFLAERFQLDLGDSDVNVSEERAGELLLVLPHREAREELSDDALDLVAGGGDGDPGKPPAAPNLTGGMFQITAQGGDPIDANLREG